VRLGRRTFLAGAALLPLTARADEAMSIDAEARWLAGIDPPSGFDAGAEWRAYAQTENERWTASAARIKAMQDWSARELTATGTVVYPFAGPDALHAIALFASAKRLFLVGLEPIGALPDASHAPAAGYFTKLGASQGDLHRLGFFRTQEMASDYSKSGVLVSVVGTIVRMGGKVTGVSGGRVDWTTKTGDARRLDYVQADLSNAGLRDRTQLIADIHALAPYVSFVKAGMYLLGESRFSYLRQTLLDESSVIVQDDTGLPIKYLDSKWAMRFYGAYEAPPKAYDDRAQPDLETALQHRSLGPLPFGMGYHLQASKACLIVAKK
jgi:hypothetical protein